MLILWLYINNKIKARMKNVRIINNNKLYKDVPIGLTTRDFKSTFLINRDLLTRLKVAVNPDRKFVLSSYIERGDNNDIDNR